MSTFLYNPDRKNRNHLIDEFVIRTKVLNGIFSDIQSGDMKYPEQHYLLLGPRGTGKTTLLLRLKYAVEDDHVLNKWLLPVIFSEEQYHIGKLSDVWEHIAAYLEDEYDFEGITIEIIKHLQDRHFEEKAFSILTKALDKKKKKIILLVDNIGDLLKRFDRLEVHRLRAILQSDAHIRLIATTPVVLIEVIDYTQPLFEFFKVIQLQGLDYNESVLLLKKLAVLNNETKKIDRIIDKNPSRIETLRTLSGGIPRTIALLFQVFVDNEHGNALSDLEKVLDAVTPLYKHRMDDLPAQQQKIVDVVARNWEAISVKQLTERLRLESKIISAQLRQLEKNQVIEKRATSTKNHIYLLKERFFNIWYLMRYGRKQDRESVIWLVRFLEMWCDKKELEKRVTNYISKIQKGDMDKRSEEFYAQVYSFFEKIKPEIKLSLKNHISEHLSQQIKFKENEIEILFNKYFKEGNWDKFLEISEYKYGLGESQWGQLYELSTSDMFVELVQSVNTKIQMTFDKDPSGQLIIRLIALLVLKESVFIHIPYNYQGKLKITLKSFRILYNKIESKYKIQVLSDVIINLLLSAYYQLASDFLNKILTGEIASPNHNILLYVTKYFTENKNEDVLSPLGSEQKEIVTTLIQYIIANPVSKL